MSTIYIHWPYCLSKCYYCDFNSIVCYGNVDYIEDLKLYKDVLHKFHQELYRNEDITSIYFGGGTPSLLDCEFIYGILNEIYKKFKLINNPEITIEANPKTINKYKAQQFKAAGINRISIGVQSLIDKDLRILGRIHNSYDAITCIYDIVTVFNNVSIDLIYNRPGQNVIEWEKELLQVCKLPIQHLSLYELIIEDNTYMKYLINKGFLQVPNQSSEFFENTIDIARENGFEIYEISNYVKSDTKLYSQHNLSYWKYDEYYGIGPGAHSRVKKDNCKYVIEQASDIATWSQWAKNFVFDLEKLSDNDIYEEQLIMGLRTKFGICIGDLDPAMVKQYSLYNKMETLYKNSYIINSEDRLILTRNGILKLNMIVEYLTKN